MSLVKPAKKQAMTHCARSRKTGHRGMDASSRLRLRQASMLLPSAGEAPLSGADNQAVSLCQTPDLRE